MWRVSMFSGLLAAAAAAQVQDADRLAVLLRDPQGKPVEGARGHVTTRLPGSLPALQDFAVTRYDRFAFAVPTAQRQGGTSDQTGLLRFAAGEHPPNGCAASGFVHTESGLGALIVDLQPGRAQRLDLQPMAALTTATGTLPFRVFARAIVPDGRAVTLPPLALAATTARLPAGQYELWVHADHEGWIWRRCTLRSARTELLSWTGDAKRVRRSSDQAMAWPAGRPEVQLFRGEELVTTLRGEATQAPCFGFVDGKLHGPAQPPASSDDDTAGWPPRRADQDILRLHPVADTDTSPSQATFVVQRRADGAFGVIAGAQATGSRSASGGEPTRWFDVPRPPPGDTWLLFVAAGFAPQARPWRGDERFPFALERGVPLHVIAKDERGMPVVDLVVEYTPVDMEPATVRGYSDARGTARLGPVLGPGVLHIVDPRFANQRLDVDAVPADGLAVTVAAGSELRGAAVWPGGAPATGVVVTLRDPAGVLQPMQRTVVTGADGTFVFTGLPEQRPLVLFATTQRDGRTWSAKLDRLRAAGEPCELVIQDEDPQLGPPKGR